jgi:hypothetical protein
MSKTYDQESFFKSVLDGLRYTHRKTPVPYTTPRQLYRAATSTMLQTYAQHTNERQIRQRLKANRFEMNGVPMKLDRKVLLQMYKKRKNNGSLAPTDTEYEATSTVIGHPIYITMQSPKGLIVKQHMQPERQHIIGSPIILGRDENTGHYTLDIKRTQHWSLYGAVAAAMSTAADQLYDDVKRATMAAIRENPEPYRAWFIKHLETSPRINYTKNVISTYLRHYKNTFLESVNQVEIQAMANVLQRAITVQTPTGVVRAVPTGNTTAPPLGIQIQDGHYTSVNTNRPSTPSDQLDTIDSLIAMFERATTTNTKTQANTDDAQEPDTKELLKRHARLLDIVFDGLTAKHAKARAETLLDEMPGYRDMVHQEYEKYIRSLIKTQHIPNAYRLDMSGRQTPPSNISYNVDFTGLSPDDARFKRDVEMKLVPKHADSIQRQFDAYMAHYQGPNRENTASAISERLEELRDAATHVQSPQEARRVDTEIHNARSDVIEYIQTHHPETMSQVIEETTAAPPKVARRRQPTGDALGVGTLVVGGLSLISSYASVWRMVGK